VQVRVFPLAPSLGSAGGAGGGAGDEAAARAALVPAALCDDLDARLFLLYTGRTRLAKHLLQRVLRQWAVRENGITATVEGLRTTAAAKIFAYSDADSKYKNKQLFHRTGPSSSSRRAHSRCCSGVPSPLARFHSSSHINRSRSRSVIVRS
jgi:hypothetical protein